jgi:DNA-binding NarL/FixJ family response regulator
MSTRVVLADDHEIVLEGLRAMLERERDIDVVGLASNGREVIEVVQNENPDVVLMDLSMPGLNGIDATRRLTVEQPAVRVLFLSMHADRRFIATAIASGAAGYILKDQATEEVVRGIRAVMERGSYLCPRVAAIVVDDYRMLVNDGLNTEPQLTDREREVVQLMAEGLRTKDIAECLHVSVKTVSTHREHIKQKLGIRSLAGLTKYAIRHGLTTVNRDHDEHEGV